GRLTNCRFDDAPGSHRQSRSTRYPPYERVGIEDDHLLTSHSAGSITGSRGLSYRNRLPCRRARAASASFFETEGGAISAMTLPREVTLTRCPRFTFARYAGRFCLSSVTLTSSMTRSP